jgi:sialate O-acetylesterase
MEKQTGKLVLTFEHVGEGLYAFDANKPVGFAIAGSDQKFVWADAVLEGKDKIILSSKDVAEPVAARYAWAENPVCNVYSSEKVEDPNPHARYSLLPLTPFRTDDWKGKTADKKSP